MNQTCNGRNSRVLIVDDNRAIHEDFRKILVKKQAPASSEFEAANAVLFGEEPQDASVAMTPFELDSAFQGQEGLAMVQKAVAEGRPYAMAFMDVRMPPGWDGVETTAKVWEVDPDLQVVICTAYSDCSWDEMLRKLGQSDRLVILKKPFDSIEVLQLANSLTRKWQLLQESKGKVIDLEKMVVARTAQMVQEQEKFRTIFENSPDGIYQIAPDGNFLAANPALASIYGYASPEELMAELKDVQSQLYLEPRRHQEFRQLLERERIVRGFESEIKCKDGSIRWICETACKATKLDGSSLYYQGFVVDITAQKQARQERNLMEAHLRQAQKLESVGQLAAGIAHEINTPIQYIGDNIRFVLESFTELGGLLAECQKLATAVQAHSATQDMVSAVESISRTADLEYLSREIPAAARQSLDGVKHVAKIVRAMKEFSHPGSTEKAPVDLNHAIETTLTVARNEWKYVAEVVTELAPDLPAVQGLPAELNQVILNLIVNATHAIGDVVKNVEGTKGTIKITTRKAGAWVEIVISDTGAGIPEAIRHRIFEPFFTTKEVGKGTGQGLAIARSTVVKKHGGELFFESTVGKGTIFTVRLPASADGAKG
jgi:two-component system, NtrC family, sensor kinase